MSLSALELFEAGQLADAILAMNADVKAAPADITLRSRLTEFLCVAGDLERAERQLEAIMLQDPKTALRVAGLRQFLRADEARRQVWGEGRAPEFTAEPPAHATLRLEALMHLRAGQLEEAAASLERAEAERPAVRGTHNGEAFDDFRDLDDLTGGMLEVLTVTGKYFWVPLEQVEEAIFTAPDRPLDRAWRTVQLSVRGGPEGEVMIPSTYLPPAMQPPASPLTEAQRMGRETDWTEIQPGCMLGRGLRSFLVGEESRTIMELRQLTFAQE
ncbi:type VI secretion system accessory protein TagJ [Xanthobacter sp. TB0139]|uniref:type VI secretion system accessory protein TagJ n=1 Tax=Xanthobacter sp. TB0139 TaxID=3459178 RepID=UPI00403A4642